VTTKRLAQVDRKTVFYVLKRLGANDVLKDFLTKETYNRLELTHCDWMNKNTKKPSNRGIYFALLLNGPCLSCTPKVLVWLASPDTQSDIVTASENSE
jgi:hypothetical protein